MPTPPVGGLDFSSRLGTSGASAAAGANLSDASASATREMTLVETGEGSMPSLSGSAAETSFHRRRDARRPVLRKPSAKHADEYVMEDATAPRFHLGKMDGAKARLSDALRALLSTKDDSGGGSSGTELLPALLADFGMVHNAREGYDEATVALRLCMRL